MDIIKCDKCGKIICHCEFPWDSGGGEKYFCIDCKPLTEEEIEKLDYAKYLSKKRKTKGTYKSP